MLRRLPWTINFEEGADFCEAKFATQEVEVLFAERNFLSPGNTDGIKKSNKAMKIFI